MINDTMTSLVKVDPFVCESVFYLGTPISFGSRAGRSAAREQRARMNEISDEGEVRANGIEDTGEDSYGPGSNRGHAQLSTTRVSRLTSVVTPSEAVPRPLLVQVPPDGP